MMSKELGEFYIGDLLSVAKCRFLSPAGIVGVNDFLKFMIGSERGRKMLKYPLFDVAEICRPYLLEQYPQLEEIDDSAVNHENWQEWLLKQIKIHGEKFTIQPLPAEVDIEKELCKTPGKNLL